MVQGGTDDELTTSATQTNGRPMEDVRGGTVQERPSSAMCLAKRPFQACCQPLSCGVRSHAVRAQRSFDLS